MKRINVAISILLISLLGFFLIACQKENEDSYLEETKIETVAEEEIEEEQKEIIVAVNVDGSSKELPLESVWMNRSRFWGGLVFQGLLIADENISNVNPDLCEEYIISTDGMKYTFNLKENLFWHDGEKLTAEDVVWSIETYFKVQETNGFVKRGLQQIAGADDFEKGKTDHISGIVVRGNDITINLKEDDAGFLSAIAQLAILPKHCLQDVPVEEFSSCEFWEMPIGSGPYKIVENKDNKEAVLVVNKDYSGKAPSIKQIRYKALDYPGTDEFDFTISSDPVIVNYFMKDSRYNVIKTENLYYRYLIFNLDQRTGENEGLLNNATVRKALSLAIDKERIVREIYGQSAIVIDGGIPKEDSWYMERQKDMTGYQPELAKEMLKKVGYDFSKTLIVTRYNLDEISERLLDEIAECWRDLGIRVEIVPIQTDSTNKLFVEADWYDIALKNLSAVDYTEWYFEYSSENHLWSEILNNRKEFNSLVTSINRSPYANDLSRLYYEIQRKEEELVYKIPIAIVPQYVIYNNQKLDIPEMEFPNLWYYFDLDMADWSIIE